MTETVEPDVLGADRTALRQQAPRPAGAAIAWHLTLPPLTLAFYFHILAWSLGYIPAAIRPT